jgi:mono/diheme cytochrome c family protein
MQIRHQPRWLWAAVFPVCLPAFVAWTPADAQPKRSTREPPAARQTIDQYCVGCHNQRMKAGALELDKADFEAIPAQSEMWEKVVAKLRSRTMPPAGTPRPDRATYDATASWIEAKLDTASPYAGRPVLHRLNRAEYANAIRDLLDLEVDVNSLLPPDDAAFGFDNISEMLGVSPALQERYLGAALRIAALAIGDPAQTPSSYTWRIPQDLSQDQHLEGLPLGTVGGKAVKYTFPLDAEYKLQAKLYRTNLNIMRGLQTAHQVEFAIDGKRVHLANIGGQEDLAAMYEAPTDTGDAVDARLQVTVPVTAGPHTISVAFVQNSQFAEPTRLQAFGRSSVDNFDWAGHPHLQVLTIGGPFRPTGVGETPSRRKIFICDPSSVRTEEPCVKRIMETLVRRAYRQPQASTDDVARVMKFYREGRKDGLDRGIQAALERILASPKFLFRAERDPVGLNAGALYQVSDSDLASRLSFFLWSSIPDDTLLTSPLSKDTTLEREVLRMLADPKSKSLIDNFAGQWLQLRNLRNFQPNTDLFPDFDDNLRQGFRRETELLFQSIMKEDRSVLDLMTADYTFVNERLAKHYGIPDIYGSQFRRVAVTDEARKGLLGQGSILALTSHAERTSPVVRGKWVLENLLGLQVPPPPADVPPLPERKDGEKPKTMREQMAVHRANAVCAACHKTLDPIGFSLENFDAVGAWRSTEAGAAIDTRGELADGTKINGPVELRKALLARPENFVTTVIEKLMIYALGRGLDARDMPQVRAIVRKAARDNYKFSTLVLGVVRSTPFHMNTAVGRQEQVARR